MSSSKPLAKIIPQQLLACPHCKKRVLEEELEALASGEVVACSKCHKSFKLPDQVVQKIANERYLGGSLDITC